MTLKKEFYFDLRLRCRRSFMFWMQDPEMFDLAVRIFLISFHQALQGSAGLKYANDTDI